MDKSRFIEIKNYIQSEIDALREELRDAEKEYIESNMQFPIGSKVCVTVPAHTAFSRGRNIFIEEQKRFAYVLQYEICCNEVVPVLLKAKKDGSASKIKDYLGSYEKVELA